MSALPGKKNSSALMAGFILGLCFAGIFALCYGLLTGPLSRHLSLPAPDWVNSAFHSVLISSVGTALCFLFFLLPEKRLVPMGFGWMAFFVFLAYLLSACYFKGEKRSSLLIVISLFCLVPVLLGSVSSWLVFSRLDRDDD